MADTTDLIEKIIDLKIERATAAVLGEIKKLGDAHNHLAQTVVPPLVADLNKRKAAEEKTKDEQIAALQKELAALRPPTSGIVIPEARG